MNSTTIREENYDAIKALGVVLGVVIPRTLSPIDEYTILVQGLFGPALVRTIRTASLMRCNPQHVFLMHLNGGV